jgi:hypothetical protein
MAKEFGTDYKILRFLIEKIVDPEKAPPPASEAKAERKTRSRVASMPTPTTEHEKKLAALKNLSIETYWGVQEEQFMRHLKALFKASALEKNHGLALRLMWIIFHNTRQEKDAASKFLADCKVVVAGEHYNLALKNAFFAILYNDRADTFCNLDGEEKVTFYKPFKQPLVLPALFSALRKSKFEYRALSLEDLNTTLIGSPGNCDYLTGLDNWLAQALHLLTDLPKSKKKLARLKKKESKHAAAGEDEPEESPESLQIRKRIYGFVMNIFAVVNFDAFGREHFQTLVESVFDRLFRFAGYSPSSASIFSVILLSLSNKLKSKSGSKLFGNSDHSTVTWVSFTALYNVVKTFVLRTAHLKYLPKADKGKQVEAKQSGLAFSAAQYGHSKKALELADDEQSRFLVSKSRAAASELDSAPKFSECKKYGIHINDENKCSDLQLVKSLLALFRTRKLDTFNVDLFVGEAHDAVYVKNCVKQFGYLEDLVLLLTTIQRIKTASVGSGFDPSALSNRFLTNVAERFWNAGPSDRASLVEELEQVAGLSST